MSDWLFQTAYVRVWEQLHRAEEAMILVAPLERVIADGTTDELRLQHSAIENGNELAQRVRQANDVLKARVLRTPVVVAVGPGVPGGVPGAVAHIPSFEEERLARETIRQVRYSIHKFRDESRLGLVRARNQLLRTIFAALLACYALLALVVAVRVPSVNLIAGISFFLVGVLVGLFNRLYLDASTQTAVEDYGLSVARLMYTPLVSGIAALGGVLIVPMLSALVNPGTTTNVNTLNSVVPALGEIFHVTNRPFGLVIAAVFGLSPATLLSRLQQEAEQYKNGLKSTETHQTPRPA